MDWHTIQLLLCGWVPGFAMAAIPAVIYDMTHPTVEASRPTEEPPPSIDDPWWGPREREAFGWDATEKFIAATNKILNPTYGKADEATILAWAEPWAKAEIKAKYKAEKEKALALPKAGYINEQDGPDLPRNGGKVLVGTRARASIGYKAVFMWNDQFHALRVWWPDWVIDRTYAVDIPAVAVVDDDGTFNYDKAREWISEREGVLREGPWTPPNSPESNPFRRNETEEKRLKRLNKSMEQAVSLQRLEKVKAKRRKYDKGYM